MKLKTLKDIKEGDYYSVNRRKLKAEAVKWVKLSPNEKAKLITETPLILVDEIIREDVAINKALIKIFNITEDDLIEPKNR